MERGGEGGGRGGEGEGERGGEGGREGRGGGEERGRGGRGGEGEGRGGRGEWWQPWNVLWTGVGSEKCCSRVYTHYIFFVRTGFISLALILASWEFSETAFAKRSFNIPQYAVLTLCTYTWEKHFVPMSGWGDDHACMGTESFRTHNSSLEGATELKFAPFCSS